MANGDNHHHHQHQNLQQRSTTFLPMLCSSLCIKDVKLSNTTKFQTHRSASSSSSSSASNDPSSPKVSCIGHVKRINRVVGTTTPHTKFPTAAATATAHAKRHKFTASVSTSRIERAVDIAKLDPPLPVIKRAASDGGRVEVNLWKRRSCRATLKSLHLQQIHVLAAS